MSGAGLSDSVKRDITLSLVDHGRSCGGFRASRPKTLRHPMPYTGFQCMAHQGKMIPRSTGVWTRCWVLEPPLLR
jgi:hypothetical protein